VKIGPVTPEFDLLKKFFCKKKDLTQAELKNPSRNAGVIYSTIFTISGREKNNNRKSENKVARFFLWPTV